MVRQRLLYTSSTDWGRQENHSGFNWWTHQTWVYSHAAHIYWILRSHKLRIPLRSFPLSKCSFLLSVCKLIFVPHFKLDLTVCVLVPQLMCSLQKYVVWLVRLSQSKVSLLTCTVEVLEKSNYYCITHCSLLS